MPQMSYYMSMSGQFLWGKSYPMCLVGKHVLMKHSCRSLLRSILHIYMLTKKYFFSSCNRMIHHSEEVHLRNEENAAGHQKGGNLIG